ncbi:hypothetical protein [Natronomonas sp. LN261]|jgi:hypothetical protein|uniref:hypothetical protein n=1 Tax=Natronomonas sp. LN261 TaxID=2750669 RepID=UPI0015EF4991|nr:hypothetical protein [Natronomonas sp. LN261]
MNDADANADTDTDMNTNTAQDPDDSRIEQLMREQDMTREQAQAAVETVQAGGDDPTVCSDCGRPKNREEGRAVSQYPDPETGEERALCSACFSDRVAELTLLSPQQAQILAYDLADWQPTEIMAAVGVDSGNLSGQRSRTKQKHVDAIEQLEEAQRTLFVLEELNPEAGR